MKDLRTIGSLVVATLLLTTTPSLAAPSQMQDTSRRLYDRVMEEFKHRDYEAALAGYRMGRYKDALTSFYNVVSYYPLSQKLAASTLKIGQTYTRLGDQEKARMMYERVVDQYPDSSEAELARKAIDATIAKSDPAPHTPE
jgi:outer membrane protein assembly factor BamD (BamD/ComL family)